MMKQTLIFSWCGVLALTAAPLAGAHLTNTAGSWTSGTLTGDNCRYNGNADFDHPVFGDALNAAYSKPKKAECTTNSGVSGNYIGAGQPATSSDAAQFALYPLTVAMPNGYTASTFANCDFEVLGTGGGVGELLFADPELDPTDDLLDEPVADDDPDAGESVWSTTIYTDGTFDDGGVGGACHASAYAEESYNTKGCPGVSHAEDALTEEKVWIAAGCDDQVRTFGVVTCLATTIGTGGANLQDCLNSVTCLVGIPTACPDVSFVGCGGDGAIDRINLGKGGGDRKTGQKNGPSQGQPWEGQAGPLQNLAGSNKKEARPGIGVNYPSTNLDHPECTGLGRAITVVLNGVEANAGDVVHKVVDSLAPIAESKTGQGENTFPNVEYSVATAGWIDWTFDNGTDFNSDQGGITVNLCDVPNVRGAVDIINDLLDGPDADGDVIDCPTGDLSAIDICNIDILVVDVEATPLCPTPEVLASFLSEVAEAIGRETCLYIY